MRRKRIKIWPMLLATVAIFGFLGIGIGIFGLLPQGNKVYEGLPWNLTLVNSEYALPEDWNIEVTQLRDDQQVDSRIYPELQSMFDACRGDGLYPLVWSSYRDTGEQQRLMNEKIENYVSQGMSRKNAEQEAALWVAEPGHSEHELGMAVDINSESEELCSSWDVYEWLRQHCWEYGFILRYPEDKTEITGIDYEPWHFRYVGKEAAKEIMESGICLEEYIELHYGK